MTRRCDALLAACAVLTLWACPALAQDAEVDLELVLAVDVSRSMDPEEQHLQKNGHIAALQHPEVLAAISAGLLGRIAATYVEWGAPGSQTIVAPWTVIDGVESAAAFTAEISGAEVLNLRSTSISGALLFSAGLFDGNGFRGTRQVIDVSGDGPNGGCRCSARASRCWPVA